MDVASLVGKALGWDPSKLRIQPIVAGLTNKNYRLDYGGRTFFLRMPGPATELLAVDRENELHNTRAAARAAVGPRVLQHDPNTGAILLEWLPGRTMSNEAFQAPGMPARIAEALRRLHAGPRFRDDFDMFQIQPRYLRLVQERGFRLPERYLEFEPQVRRIEEAMAVRDEGTVPCNNDLLAENFIDVGDEFRLIDYEYSGNNDACFELGNVWSESNLSLEQLDELVSHYYARPLANKVARARLWGLMSKYGWTLWASIQDGVSDIDFDFWGWGMEKYERAVAEFDGPDFERLLEDVRRED